ncbi:hypothetical protein AURDEDRAFT_112511 [Auricularia subglabra TFB-10046 SS5]|nr:hypothetical protein AURDEDRAFT_112511 [Auricularia subglabra TFB-10046 SS5]
MGRGAPGTRGRFRPRWSLLSLNDIGGLAVAHFGFPKHRLILLDSAGDRRLAFWASTPEIARGLRDLHVRHLQEFDFHSPLMWGRELSHAWTVAIRELGITEPFPEEDYQQFVQLTDIAAGIAPDSPAARAAGLVAVETPGVAVVVDRSHRAQRLFAFNLGFSPVANIQPRVLARIVKGPRDTFWGQPARHFNLGSEEAQE